MANVLEKIVADKRQEIAQRKVDFPLAHFKDGLTPSTRSFFDALNQPCLLYTSPSPRDRG